ncbi:FAD/NAD(P)-binding domain-containing protein [Peniophora sp. CONT]|nr:FAD/NAD(P)-binding domain-containing protein [Peniophora sp. CONT]
MFARATDELPDITQASLPTFLFLGVTPPEDIDALSTARTWFHRFSNALCAAYVDTITALCFREVFWRDLLALTWDIRTIYSTQRVQPFLADRLSTAKITEVKLDEASVQLQKPFEDVVWIQAEYGFETEVGKGKGMFRLIPTPDGWKAHAIMTALEDLKGAASLSGFMDSDTLHSGWEARRKREVECTGDEMQPKVIIIGAGLCGLLLAARVKALGIKSLLVDQNVRIGDTWRKRYDTCCLHSPVWFDQMPYLSFPTTWPVFPHAYKLADWLETYAKALELDVWTSSEVTHATQDPASLLWSVEIIRAGKKQTLKVPHVVFAVGVGGGVPKMPTIPGSDVYKGQVLHASAFKIGRDFTGKKVVVVGACTSAFDVCSNLYDSGANVTMFQRSSTYVVSSAAVGVVLAPLYHEGSDPDHADLVGASFPNWLARGMHQRVRVGLAEMDREILEGLKSVGFRLNSGMDGAGFLLLAGERLGGFYPDVGGSKYLIDHKVKLKNDAQIKEFSASGLVFNDGSSLEADAVIFATGYADTREAYRSVLGDQVTEKLSPLWGLDDEGEIRGSWRDSGVPRLWCMAGNLAMARFFSKHLALQIKAIEDGVWDGFDRYDGH